MDLVFLKQLRSLFHPSANRLKYFRPVSFVNTSIFVSYVDSHIIYFLLTHSDDQITCLAIGHIVWNISNHLFFQSGIKDGAIRSSYNC